MKRRTRFLSMLLAALIICALPAMSAGAEGETVAVSVMMPHFGGVPTGTIVQDAWEELMSEKFGVTFEFDYTFIPWGDYAEKTNLALASDDFPDLLYLPDYDTSVPYQDQGIFVELNGYEELMPNYMNIMTQVRGGESKVYNEDGECYGFRNVEYPRLDQGIASYSVAAYRKDIFDQNGIAVPSTTEEFYEAAKALKELYPDQYPVNRSGSYETYTFHTGTGIFWNGEAYEFGPATENYRDMLRYVNKLYAEELIDPESLTESNDERVRKALNGSFLMMSGVWFNTPEQWNNNEEVDVEWMIAFFPDDANYGAAWQAVSNVNEVNYGPHFLVINEDADNRELLIRLCDEQYSEETTRLVTWGIEGTTYNVLDDGSLTFIDSIRNAVNPWAEGDNYGMRASASYRPGLQLAIDTKAFTDFAADDICWINGEVVITPWETAHPDISWPDSEMIPPTLFAPAITWTTEEQQDNATIMTAVTTYVDEMNLKFIRGEASLEDDWDSYVETLRSMGYETVVDAYNAKAAALAE